MKRVGSWILACTMVWASVSTATWAQQTATQPVVAPPAVATTPVAPMSLVLPQPPALTAKAYLLMDMNSGQVLAEKNPDMSVEPASLTKLMTAYLVFDALRANRLALDQKLMVSARARNMPGSRMFVEQNSQVSVEDLIKGMIVQSGNDATVVLAEGVGGSVENFVAMMNQQAQLMGMRGTVYFNPEGLTAPGHLTTARDLAILSTRLIADFPQEYKYYSLKDFTYPPNSADAKSIPQDNRNRLLRIDPTVDGLKTGHTDAAGYCLVASSAREFPNLSQKRRLLSIVLGTESDKVRTEESQNLLNWGFQAWDDVELFAANQAIVTPTVWKGSANEAKLGTTQPIVVSVPRGMASNLKPVATYTTPLLAPIDAGQEVGELKITLETPSGSMPIATHKLVVLEEVSEAGFFGRMWDAMRLWFE